MVTIAAEHQQQLVESGLTLVVLVLSVQKTLLIF